MVDNSGNYVLPASFGGIQSGDNNWYHYFSGSFNTYVEKESKMDKAFKIIKKLMDCKMIKEDISVKEFMDLCEIISREI